MSPVVLFDGECNLCNGAVQFVLDHERAAELRFATLGGEAARTLLDGIVGEARSRELRTGDPARGPGSFVLVDGNRVLVESGAALRVAGYLKAPWRWAAVLVVVPRVLRDAAYRFVGRNRYRWFGRSASCRVATPELAARFL